MTESSLNAFKGTIAQERKLKDVIAKHKDMPGALLPVLQEAQGIYGYLPIEVQQMVAPEFLTQKRSPATPLINALPLVAP